MLPQFEQIKDCYYMINKSKGEDDIFSLMYSPRAMKWNKLNLKNIENSPSYFPTLEEGCDDVGTYRVWLLGCK